MGKINKLTQVSFLAFGWAYLLYDIISIHEIEMGSKRNGRVRSLTLDQ